MDAADAIARACDDRAPRDLVQTAADFARIEGDGARERCTYYVEGLECIYE